jgi:hypothetical protein
LYLPTPDDISAYLDLQSAGASIELDIGAVGYKGTWEKLLLAIQSACEGTGKTVMLDISKTTLATTGDVEDVVFDPRNGNDPYDTGEPYIVELVLPEAATKINGRGFGQGQWQGQDPAYPVAFTSLTKVSGANVKTIGDSAFFKCAALETAKFLEAETIEPVAFAGTALTEAYFPAATSIGDQAFEACKALKTANFPALKTIGIRAFEECTALETANFPAVQTIHRRAFSKCKALTSLTLPAVPPGLEGDGEDKPAAVFEFTYDTNKSTLYIRVDSEDEVAAYGENGAFPPAEVGSNKEKYGENHKQIVITDDLEPADTSEPTTTPSS